MRLAFTSCTSCLEGALGCKNQTLIGLLLVYCLLDPKFLIFDESLARFLVKQSKFCSKEIQN